MDSESKAKAIKLGISAVALLASAIVLIMYFVKPSVGQDIGGSVKQTAATTPATPPAGKDTKSSKPLAPPLKREGGGFRAPHASPSGG